MQTIRNLIKLNGRKALITGAAGHLGRSISMTLAELGADLILIDIDNNSLDKFKNLLNTKYKVEVITYKCNLEDESERYSLIRKINKINKLDILINNAAFVGTSNLKGWNEKFEYQSIETWRRAIEVNLTAAFHLCQGLSGLMFKSKYASIINIGSIYGDLGPDWRLYEDEKMSNPAAYGVSKAGLLQLTRWLATTLAPNIRVNAISPGGILRNQSEKFVNRYKEKTPLKRMATENDICGALIFLASDMSNYVTGQNLIVDGGWGAW